VENTHLLAFVRKGLFDRLCHGAVIAKSETRGDVEGVICSKWKGGMWTYRLELLERECIPHRRPGTVRRGGERQKIELIPSKVAFDVASCGKVVVAMAMASTRVPNES
jgi:hypothetical protein